VRFLCVVLPSASLPLRRLSSSRAAYALQSGPTSDLSSVICHLVVRTSFRRVRLQLLGDLFQSVTLDDIANLVFIEISELAAALDPGSDLFYIVLESAQGRQSAVINRLPLAQNPRSAGADDSAIGHITTRDCAL